MTYLSVSLASYEQNSLASRLLFSSVTTELIVRASSQLSSSLEHFSKYPSNSVCIGMPYMTPSFIATSSGGIVVPRSYREICTVDLCPKALATIFGVSERRLRCIESWFRIRVVTFSFFISIKIIDSRAHLNTVLSPSKMSFDLTIV